MKKILLNPWTALLTLALIVGVRYIDPAFVESVRLRYFDQLIVNQPAVDIPVHTVNIDEAALDKYGQFPFPRGTYADIIHDLYQRNAGLVVFNILMPEFDRFKQDGQLAAVLKQYPVVLPALGSTKEKNIPKTPGVSIIGEDPAGLVVEYPGLISSVPLINNNAAGVGIVNTFSEVDGVMRRLPLVIYSNEKLYPSLALETLRVAAGDPSFQIKISKTGIEALRVPKFGKINTNDVGQIWVDWSKKPKEHSLMSLPKDFNGEIVIVGLSAAGLANPVSTARGEVWPHDAQASMLGTLTTQTNIQRPGYADDLETAAIFAAGLLLLILTRWTYVGLAATVIIIGGGIEIGRAHV
jgi:adenylate cyclase